MSIQKYSIFFIERKILGWLTPIIDIPLRLIWISIVIFSIAGFVNPFSVITWLGLGIAVASWFVLLVAKWPQVKKLDVFSFGIRGLPLENQCLYRLSYILLGLGAILMFSTHFSSFLTL